VKQIGIVVALPGELRTLTKHQIQIGCWQRISDKVLIAVSGAGPSQASEAAKLLLAQGANALLSWGCAAALQSHLRAGYLVLPQQIKSVDGTVFKVDPDWHRHVSQHISTEIKVMGTGMLVESRQLVASVHAKQNLAITSNAVAVDMESAALARFAEQIGIPFMAVRAIADPLEMSLPKAVSFAINPSGDVNMSRLLSHLFLHPWEITDLIRLGLQFRAAQKTLHQVAILLRHGVFGMQGANNNWASS